MSTGNVRNCALLVLAATVVFGCQTSLETYRCTANRDCILDGVEGYCEDGSICSFADPDCLSGRRFGTLSGDSSEECVLAAGNDAGAAENDAGAADASQEPATPMFTDPEGGMVMFEYMRFSTALRVAFPSEIVRSISHFTSTGGDDHVFMTMGSGDNLHGLDECNHVSADDITWPTNDVNAQSHVNVGSLTISGGPTDLVIDPRLTGNTAEMTDMIGRLHSGAWYQTVVPEPANYITEDEIFTVAMAGSDEYPATTYDEILYVPSALVMTSPTGDLVIDRPEGGFTEPLAITWESGASGNAPQDTDVLSLVMLVDPTGSNIVEFCVALNDGMFVIPSEVLEEFVAEQPDGGILYVGNYSHRLGRFDNRGAGGNVFDRRIDFLGIWFEVMAIRINQL